MSNYSSLKATINANVKANGNQEITGPVMNSVLNAMVDSLGTGYQYKGKAVPSTNPGTPDSKVYYLASEPGTYTNFNGIVVSEGEVAILKWDTAWSKEVTGVATAAQVTQLGQEVGYLEPKDSTSDFAISDENGNDIAEFNGGHIRTKYFDSSKTPNEDDTDTDVDFEIGDENGEVIVRFKDGHIRTKNFDSSKSNGISFLPRPNNILGKDNFSVKVNINKPKLDTELAQGDSYIEGTDWGWIKLPTSYSADGEPIRLIIACHGAGTTLDSYKNKNSASFLSPVTSDIYIKFGFAVMDMFANPQEFSGTTSELHFGNPVALQCYKKGFDYVMKNYNVRKDGIFVIGNSMGGLTSFDIVQSGMFPVLAQVGFCPCVELFKQAFCDEWSSDARRLIPIYYDFDGTAPTPTTATDGTRPSDAEISYFKANILKTMGYYPIFHNVIGDYMETFDVMPNNFKNVSSAEAQAEKAIYDKLTLHHPCPIKVFHCTNDNVMNYRYSQYLVEMMQRGGQNATLRLFSQGGHSAWASGTMITTTDIDGNSFEVKTSMFEAIEFIKRFN